MDRDELTRRLGQLHAALGHNDTALARTLHLKASGNMRELVSGKRTPEIETCIHIAAALKVHSNDVLKAAGHGAAIPVLEAHYGRHDTEHPVVDPKSIELAHKIETLAPAQRAMIEAAIAAAESNAQPGRPFAQPKRRRLG